ncbi:MAG: HAD family hydrolase [Erysipelotrichaceae bacterium]|nr:HAD family hydrolase [Erysipelotrichaceae bacterium]
MKRKILFFDLDGTLVSYKTAHVPDSALKAIRMAQANGHYCIINTGRCSCTIEQEIWDSNFDGFICGGGTEITFHGKTLMHSGIPEEKIRDIFAMLMKYDVEPVFESRESIYFPEINTVDYNRTMIVNYSKNNMKLDYYPHGVYNGFTVDKFNVFHHREVDIQEIYDYLKEDFELTIRSDEYLEVMQKGHSKAQGIFDLLKYLDMDIEDTISFGDSMNDIPMLEVTRGKVVMGNGDRELFDMATYVADDIDDDGIYKAMKHLNLI